MEYENLTDDEEFRELVLQDAFPRVPRQFKERPNHFTKWRNEEFLLRFRLSKLVVRYVIDKIALQITPNTNRSCALSAEEKVFNTLYFLATGTFLRVVGDTGGQDKSTISRSIAEVLHHLANLRPEYVAMPENQEEIEQVRQEFFNISRFPRCVGAIDCTHVKIRPSSGGIDERYRNRKGFFSFNVQVVSDAKCLIRDIVCRWHGAAHDATIFANSRIRARMENREFGEESVLVGDSGYGIRNNLITPLRKLRNHMRTFGIWKKRFPVLAFGIRLHLRTVEPLIVATSVLHNIACQMRDAVPPINHEMEVAINLTENVNRNRNIRENNVNNENNRSRYNLVNNYFQNLVQN
ncbi:hypothetical protein RN001_008573 [Aquatica leii]|uniref:Putative nuclease HARBI1 n=1 Tax=Aquatica leii TaxID=1421715 RepID=A0AAN7SGX2_9COLE|nr:hypothetical protein RN001_008573 [Aquatica leii]